MSCAPPAPRLPATESPSADAEGDSTGGQTAYAIAYAIVVGHEREQVREAIQFTASRSGALHWILQEPQLGTGDAVRAARETLDQPPTPPRPSSSSTATRR